MAYHVKGQVDETRYSPRRHVVEDQPDDLQSTGQTGEGWETKTRACSLASAHEIPKVKELESYQLFHFYLWFCKYGQKSSSQSRLGVLYECGENEGETKVSTNSYGLATLRGGASKRYSTSMCLK